jgi:hypothetical protein
VKKQEERSRRRVWKFQGDREEETHHMEREREREREIGNIRFCESVL